MAPDVSVIVVNFNGQRYLETCLNALEQQDLECEIVLVDNASEDDSVAFVRKRFPAVRLVELDRNLGFAGGNNAGARAASGRYLAFLNNDTRVAPSWLGALRRAIDGTPDVGFVTSRVVYMHNPSVIDSAGDCLTRSGGAFKRGHGAPSERLARPLEVFGACGAACLFRREVFEAAGGFDEDFFLSHEDVDLSYRSQATRVPMPVRAGCGRSARRKRDNGARERTGRFLWSAEQRMALPAEYSVATAASDLTRTPCLRCYRGGLLRFYRSRVAIPVRQVGGSQGCRPGVAQTARHTENAPRVQSSDLGTARAEVDRSQVG